MTFKLHSLTVELFNDISRAARTGEKELYPIGIKKYQILKTYYKLKYKNMNCIILLFIFVRLSNKILKKDTKKLYYKY